MTPLCTAHACQQPVTAQGGYCDEHRARIASSQVTKRIDCLEVWYRIPAYDGPRRFLA